jgi:hypothetical protein
MAVACPKNVAEVSKVKVTRVEDGRYIDGIDRHTSTIRQGVLLTGSDSS